jgi:hypothetical protein
MTAHCNSRRRPPQQAATPFYRRKGLLGLMLVLSAHPITPIKVSILSRIGLLGLMLVLSAHPLALPVCSRRNRLFRRAKNWPLQSQVNPVWTTPHRFRHPQHVLTVFRSLPSDR